MIEKFSVKKEHNTQKTFDYKRGVVSLKFTLNVDNKKELKEFRECLVEAVKDVDSEIEKL